MHRHDQTMLPTKGGQIIKVLVVTKVQAAITMATAQAITHDLPPPSRSLPWKRPKEGCISKAKTKKMRRAAFFTQTWISQGSLEISILYSLEQKWRHLVSTTSFCLTTVIAMLINLWLVANWLFLNLARYWSKNNWLDTDSAIILAHFCGKDAISTRFYIQCLRPIGAVS